ncbi:hypothetical protein DPEC_G00373810 [Dallia pectoralis]|nr:hypothetical protein DPEC_G00373810 [Dallia pectoralis]
MISVYFHSLEDWPELEELKQFIPNVEFKPVLEIQKLITYDLQRFKEFRSKGIELRSGRYSEEENEQLKTNVDDFMALTGISNPCKLFYPMHYEEKEEIMKLNNQHKFHKKIAEGIPRPWHNIYLRGRKLFDRKNYKGRFTEDELHSLKTLHTLHGNSWSKISELTGRSSAALEKRFSHISKKAGRWTKRELKRLMDAMQDHLTGQADTSDGPATIRKDKMYREVPWKAVSERVKTRHWSQCRTKWYVPTFCDSCKKKM